MNDRDKLLAVADALRNMTEPVSKQRLVVMATSIENALAANVFEQPPSLKEWRAMVETKKPQEGPDAQVTDAQRKSVLALLLDVNDLLASIEELHPQWDVSGIAAAEKQVRKEFGISTVPPRRFAK
jgi:hypothetical protein